MTRFLKSLARAPRSPLAGLSPLLACAAAVFAGLTIAMTAVLTRQVVEPKSTFLVASMGATAFLVFLFPHSPLAQPWPVLGGQVLSAVAGVVCSRLIPDTAVALAVGTTCALLVMLACHCLHPPGAATAVAAALAGRAGATWLFPLAPVAMNAGLILAAAWLTHRFVLRHPYPAPKTAPHAGAARMPPFTDADLDAALAQMPEALDITRADLMEALLLADEARAKRQKA